MTFFMRLFGILFRTLRRRSRRNSPFSERDDSTSKSMSLGVDAVVTPSEVGLSSFLKWNRWPPSSPCIASNFRRLLPMTVCSGCRRHFRIVTQHSIRKTVMAAILQEINNMLFSVETLWNLDYFVVLSF